jgi:hypothetical protein
MYEHVGFPMVEENKCSSRVAINQPLRERNRRETCAVNDHRVWAESMNDEEWIAEE